MIVTLLGLSISFFAYLLAFPQPHQRRFDIYLALFAVHVGGAMAYWLLSFESGMDAFTYYRDPFNFINEDPFESGTFFIVHFVQLIRRTLGGSFLDHFLFFQCFGMVAVALLIRSFNEIADSFGTSVPLHIYLVLFLPGLHFWSAGIGKDGPMIMAASLAAWAALKVQRRLPWMGLAILIMAAIRPHVAVLVVASIGIGFLFSKQFSRKVRTILAPIAVIGLIFVAVRASERIGVGFDSDSIGSFIDNQQNLGDRFGSGAELAELPIPLKIWSLLFRPFFVDAPSIMHQAASLENAFLFYIFLYIGYHWKLVLRLMKSVTFLIYSLVFSSALILLLALVNYNIGLGQRQKMMAIPTVLLIYGTIFIYKRYLAGAALAVPAAAEEPPPGVSPAGA